MELELTFPKGYIAHPYWVEREKVINITKESGTNRARSEANRVKALTDYLHNIGMSMEEYEALCRRADRQFYTAKDVEELTFGEFPVGDHDPAEIVIPPHQILGCLTQAADQARAANRVVKRDQVRSTFVVQPIYTGKTTSDGVWERFAVVTGGAGNKLSNQRALRRNEFVRDFTGRLVIEFDQQQHDPRRVRDFVAFAGRDIGMGSSRRLGWGRFTVA
jgi:hypothetical protein